MPLLKNQGIVLQRDLVSESDAIAMILTQSGKKLQLRAFGIQKSKKRSLLLVEPGTWIEFQYYAPESQVEDALGHRKLASFKDGIILERFAEVKANYDKALILAYFLELADFSGESQEIASFFPLLQGAMHELGLASLSAKFQARIKIYMLLSFVQARVAKLYGILGDTQACSGCSSLFMAHSMLPHAAPEKIYWNKPELYFLCNHCHVSANQWDAWALSWIRNATRLRFSNFVRLQEKQFSRYTNLQEEGVYLDACINLCQDLQSTLAYFTEKKYKSFVELLRILAL